jgi:hypothetical protein
VWLLPPHHVDQGASGCPASCWQVQQHSQVNTCSPTAIPQQCSLGPWPRCMCSRYATTMSTEWCCACSVHGALQAPSILSSARLLQLPMCVQQPRLPGPCVHAANMFDEPQALSHSSCAATVQHAKVDASLFCTVCRHAKQPMCLHFSSSRSRKQGKPQHNSYPRSSSSKRAIACSVSSYLQLERTPSQPWSQVGGCARWCQAVYKQLLLCCAGNMQH